MNILLTYVGGIAGQSILKSLKQSKYSKDIKIFVLDCVFWTNEIFNKENPDTYYI